MSIDDIRKLIPAKYHESFCDTDITYITEQVGYKTTTHRRQYSVDDTNHSL